MRNKLIVLTIITGLLSINVWSQSTQNDPSNQFKIDGVAAVVGDEIILNSDVERDYIQALAQGFEIENRCDFMENILVEKLLLTKAKEDTLINITNDQVDRQVDATVQRFLMQGSEDEIGRASCRERVYMEVV